MAQQAVQVKSETLPAIHAGPPSDVIRRKFDGLARRAYEIFESNGHSIGEDLANWLRAERELFHVVHIDLSETPEKFSVRAEIPGFAASELETYIEGRRVTISGKREKREEQKDSKRIYSEFCSDQVLRAVELPSDVNAKDATATLKDGILELQIPKAAAKKIPVSQPR